MSDASVENKSSCVSSCEDRFVECTWREPSGCVEDLRVCRDSCRINDFS